MTRRSTEARTTWRVAALCAQTDPEVFFPEAGGSPAAAVAVCARCPVSGECLAFALAAGEVHGVWGGTTEADRRELLARRLPLPRRAGGAVGAAGVGGEAA